MTSDAGSRLAPSQPRAAATRGNDAAAPIQDLDTLFKEMNGNGEKRHVNHWAQVQCPYCGENFDVHFDSVQDGDSLNEDCAVCCKPIVVNVDMEEDDIHISVHRG